MKEGLVPKGPRGQISCPFTIHHNFLLPPTRDIRTDKGEWGERGVVSLQGFGGLRPPGYLVSHLSGPPHKNQDGGRGYETPRSQ